MLKDTLTIGKITGAHGIYGELKIYPMTDEAERFYDLEYFLCEGKKYDIQIARIHKQSVLIQTAQIQDRTEAEKMRGKMIEIYRKDAVELEEGQFFIEDLKGLEARDRNAENTNTMTLVDVLRAGGADVLVFKNKGGKEYMMPFLVEYVDEVNLNEGYIVVDFTKFVD